MARKDNYKPPEGTEEQYGRFLRAQKAYDEAWQLNDELLTVIESDDHEELDELMFEESLFEIDRQRRIMFSHFDGWVNTIKHLHDKKLALQEDVRTIIADAMRGALDGIEFTLPWHLVPHKLAQTIRENVTEDDVGSPPLCRGCSA